MRVASCLVGRVQFHFLGDVETPGKNKWRLERNIYLHLSHRQRSPVLQLLIKCHLTVTIFLTPIINHERERV